MYREFLLPMKNYYLEELSYLRELGAEYAREHPAIAPLLASRSTDPDVERLLEATAFLCGLVNERLDQNFPEIVQGLLDITAPHMLKPVPSQTLIQFLPAGQVRGVQHIVPGNQLDSVEVAGTRCTYTPCHPLDIYPVTGTTTRLLEKGSGEAVLETTIHACAGLGSWWPTSLSLHVHDVFGTACQWLYLLASRCTRIELVGGSERLVLSPSSLTCELPEWTILSEDSALSPLPSAARLRNYFVLPEQFLFLRLAGIAPLARGGAATSATLRFFVRASDIPRTVSPNLLQLNVVPAINLLVCNSDPFIVRQDRQEYRLSPQKDSARQLEIHSIRRLVGIQRGQVHHVYEPYTSFRMESTAGTYTVRRKRSQINGRMEHYVSLLYNCAQGPAENETLVSELLCFHHTLPLQLHEGDIRIATDTSPAMATFRNILPPSPAMPAPDDTSLMWRMFSCLHANMLPLASPEALKEFLTLWLPASDPDPTRVTLNRERVEAIRDFSCTPEERLWRGRLVHGQRLGLKLCGECFARAGERFLFGLVLDEVLAQYATINTYTRLDVTDLTSGETLSWKPRLGSRRLM